MKKHSLENKRKVIFLFPHWNGGKLGSGSFIYKIFAKLLMIKNRETTVYIFFPEHSLLSSNIERTKRAFGLLEKRVLKKIEELKDEKIEKFIFFGVSIGTITATRLANKISRQKEVEVELVLNLSSADFPFAVWNGRATQKVRKGLERQGISFDILKEEWDYLSPIQNLKYLSKVSILGFFSLKDKVLIPKNVIHLIDELAKNKFSKIHLNTFCGHFLGGLKNLFTFLFLKP